MKIKTFFVVCASLFSLGFANTQDHSLKRENIRVLLEKDATEALLEVRGPHYIFNPKDGSKISSGILGKRFVVRAVAAGLKWGQEFPGIHQLVIVPRSNETAILLNGTQYDGAISIYQAEDKINIVNEVDVESYLKATLTTQFNYPLEHEAMAAIAIAARTSAYYQIQTNRASFWHVDGKSIDYQGSALVIADSAVSHAVDSTKNLILLNQKDSENVPFMATWTEHCAGKTAALHEVFRKDLNAPKDGVEAPLASLDRKDTRWSYSISAEKLASMLNMNKITSVEAFLEKKSEKVYALRFGDGTQKNDFDFFTLQKKLGRKFLQSNDFTISLKDNEVHFSGFGKGHGVGLCLYSASTMAQNGDMAIKILSKFYPNTFITNLSAPYPQSQTVQNN
jgi:stage II sporulation protein D